MNNLISGLLVAFAVFVVSVFFTDTAIRKLGGKTEEDFSKYKSELEAQYKVDRDSLKKELELYNLEHWWGYTGVRASSFDKCKADAYDVLHQQDLNPLAINQVISGSINKNKYNEVKLYILCRSITDNLSLAFLSVVSRDKSAEILLPKIRLQLQDELGDLIELNDDL